MIAWFESTLLNNWQIRSWTLVLEKVTRCLVNGVGSCPVPGPPPRLGMNTALLWQNAPSISAVQYGTSFLETRHRVNRLQAEKTRMFSRYVSPSEKSVFLKLSRIVRYWAVIKARYGVELTVPVRA